MNELIKITKNSTGQDVVSARELHRFLEVETPLTVWMPRMFEYGFEEGKDFLTILLESTGGRPQTDFVLTIDTAKEISMIQRSEKGKQARLYFIECEKTAKDLMEINPKVPTNFKQALMLAVEQQEIIEQQQMQIENLDTVLDNLLDWVSILKVARHNKISEKEFNWRKLKDKSEELGFSVKKAESPRYGYQNLYNLTVFKACYPIFDYNIKNNN